MTRQEKYPETSTFHFFNANPHNRFTGDCVTRALSVALQIPYNQCVMEQAEMQCKTGFDSADPKGMAKYLESKGWVKHPQPRKQDGTKYTGKEWCQLLEEDILREVWQGGDRMIANIGGHHTIAIINDIGSHCKVWDTWDSTDGCIGNYWTK